MSVMRGTYKGGFDWLKGKTALLRPTEIKIGGSLYPTSTDTRTILAQFDDMSLSEAWGWTIFPREDFDIEPELNDEAWDDERRVPRAGEEAKP